MMEEKAKVPKNRLRSDNAIPDYDYLFNESDGKKDSNRARFLSKLLKINFWKIFSFPFFLSFRPRLSGRCRLLRRIS